MLAVGFFYFVFRSYKPVKRVFRTWPIANAYHYRSARRSYLSYRHSHSLSLSPYLGCALPIPRCGAACNAPGNRFPVLHLSRPDTAIRRIFLVLRRFLHKINAGPTVVCTHGFPTLFATDGPVVVPDVAVARNRFSPPQPFPHANRSRSPKNSRSTGYRGCGSASCDASLPVRTRAIISARRTRPDSTGSTRLFRSVSPAPMFVRPFVRRIPPVAIAVSFDYRPCSIVLQSTQRPGFYNVQDSADGKTR